MSAAQPKSASGFDRLSASDEYDVIVLGGGLAGLCAGIEVKQKAPSVSVLVLEKGSFPRPEAAHKVGESSVEVASHYFRNVLGVSDLLAQEVPKFGLRFFMSDGVNQDLAHRLECGPKNFLTMPSDQIDRGQFENNLAERATRLGVELLTETEVAGIEFGASGSDESHAIEFSRDGRVGRAQARWVVDASGRKGIVKKKLGLARASKHQINASWFRIDHAIDLDDWSEDPTWRGRLDAPRRLSTNHLMGDGYWVWFIPLAGDRTSVGIVADDSLHPFAKLNTFDKSMAWLEINEPQAAKVLAAHAGKRMDFLALHNFAHEAKQVFSADRWCLTGDAGIFVDPLYSPGSDFIGMSNGYICDMIRRDMLGESVEALAAQYDQAYRSLARTYLLIYQRQYRLMGHSRVMITKILWDFANYWGGVAKLFCGDRLCSPEFMVRARPLLQGFAFTNLSMQSFFREWAAADGGEQGHVSDDDIGGFINYAGVEFLASLNAALAEKPDDDDLIAQMERNLELVRNLKLEIIAEASRTTPKLAKDAEAPTTQYLADVFETLRKATVRAA